jgi:hypothetical protein
MNYNIKLLLESLTLAFMYICIMILILLNLTFFIYPYVWKCNIRMMSSQMESNMCVESSIEVVTGGGLLDSSTVVRVHYKIMLINNI